MSAHTRLGALALAGLLLATAGPAARMMLCPMTGRVMACACPTERAAGHRVVRAEFDDARERLLRGCRDAYREQARQGAVARVVADDEVRPLALIFGEIDRIDATADGIFVFVAGGHQPARMVRFAAAFPMHPVNMTSSAFG